MSDKVVLGVSGTGRLAGRFLTQAVIAQGLVFTTLHHGYDPASYDPSTENGTLPIELADEVRYALMSQHQIVAEAGSELSKVLKVNLYLAVSSPVEIEVAERSFYEFFEGHGVLQAPTLSTVLCSLVGVRVAVDVVASV